MAVRKVAVNQDLLNAETIVEVNAEPRSFKINLNQVLIDIKSQIQERIDEGEEVDLKYTEYTLYGGDFITEVS